MLLILALKIKRHLIQIETHSKEIFPTGEVIKKIFINCFRFIKKISDLKNFEQILIRFRQKKILDHRKKVQRAQIDHELEEILEFGLALESVLYTNSS